jgi:V/A-type H+-transporting ATPase subunit D
MNINIAATKTNLLKVKKSLSLTQEGYELLDEKRRILIMELTSILHVVEKLWRELDATLSDAYAMLDKALVVMGKRRLEELSCAVNIEYDLSITHRRVMGVSIPIIDLKTFEKPPYYSSLGVSFYVDETIAKFKEVLLLIAQLAEKQLALLRLAKEVQKTIRKVNALEKIYIPYYRDAVKFVTDRLDEESREAFSMLKLIKTRLSD